MKNFQLILLIIFGFLAVGGLIGFATYKQSGGKDAFVPISMWGSFPKSQLDLLVKELSNNKTKVVVNYRQIPEDSFDNELIEAIASNTAPDVIILPLDLMFRYRDKTVLIPYENISAREFQDTYVEEAELFMLQDGVVAVPFSMDPLVMYWNRSIFNNEGISIPPKYWDEFLTLSPQITTKDSFSNITRSTVALGEYRNITNAKGIISALLIQSGNPVVSLRGSQFMSTLRDSSSINSIRFYTEFANPVKTVYSWNRSLPKSLDAFLGGDLAVYFGYASELSTIRSRNPNLNFDVAPLPQIRDSQTKKTYGKIYGIAVMRGTKDVNSTFSSVLTLTGKESIDAWASASNLPPVRRDLLAIRPTSSALSVFYDSALISGGWVDPNSNLTDAILLGAIESVTTGQRSISEAMNRADEEVNRLLLK